MLKVLEFIKNHKDWEAKLTEKPFCLKIKREGKFILLAYSQIDSDFNKEIVRECRGLILDENFTPVCVPFYKFGNYGEGYAPEIDWSTARVQEKVDGSIIKLWYDNVLGWNTSTNETINAWTANIHTDLGMFRTFGQLFDYARIEAGLDYHKLDTNNTYMFELTSPYNRVVVPYQGISITHIGTRNNKTLEELDIDIGIRKPESYPLTSLEECLSTAEKMPFYCEGYVVVDANWNRVKIKSPAYVALHHLKGNGIPSKRRIVSLIRVNETDEILNYFPEFKPFFDEMKEKINIFVEKQNKIIKNAAKCKFNSKKSFAEYAKSYKFSHMLFLWYDGKIQNAEEWLWKHTDRDIVDMIEGVL